MAPRLAHDTEGTLEQAHMYWELVDRPNLIIKIPATDAGLPAIEQALYEGLNINVTLLFSVTAHERVIEAFIRGMERRREAGRPLDRHSVPSFFVSRVDTEVDKRLEALGRTDLQAAGRTGELTGPTAAQDPTPDLEALRDAGIDLEDVTEQLLREGIDAFMVPMQKLLDGIEAKRRAIVGSAR